MPAAAVAESDVLDGAPKLAPFNPSSDEVIEKFLGVAHVTEHDVVYDLGCGDGRVLLETFRKTGCTCVGVDYDKEFIRRANEQLELMPEAKSKVRFLHQDVLETDLTECTVLFMYLSVTTNEAFNEKVLEAYNRGIRICSNMFSAKGIQDEPTQVIPYSNGLLKLRYYHKPTSPPEGSLIKVLDQMLDPMQNPVIIMILNVSLLILLGSIGLMYVNDFIPVIHIYMLSFLTVALMISVNWVFALLRQEKLKQDKKD